MTILWHYAKDGEPLGPVPSAELKRLAAAGVLEPDDWVYRDGLSDWVVARRVRGLFPESAMTESTPCAESPAATDATLPPVLAGLLAAAVSPAAGCPGASAVELSRRALLSEAQVVPDAARCVQCGICSFNCPMGIDVRAHAWRGRPIHDSHCLTCSECVKRCPRGVLRFDRIPLFATQ